MRILPYLIAVPVTALLLVGALTAPRPYLVCCLAVAAFAVGANAGIDLAMAMLRQAEARAAEERRKAFAANCRHN